MTRLLTDGAESGNGIFWDSGSITTTASYKRSGVYSYLLGSGGGWVKYFPETDEFYFRFGFYWNTANNYTLLYFKHDSNTLATLGLSSIYKLTIYGQTSTNVINTSGAWNLIEVYIKVADASGRCIVKLNGIVEIDYTGDTKPGSDTTINSFVTGSYGTTVGYIDDIALNDTNGSEDNSWCGDGRLERIAVAGNGDDNSWIGSDGDSTNNYLLVDEVPHDSDTTYVTTSGIGIQDMYTISPFTDTNKKIIRVTPVGIAKDALATGGVIKLGIKASDIVYLASGIQTPSVYTRLTGDGYTTYPASGQDWNKELLDAIQFVINSE